MLGLLASVGPASASPEFSGQTGQACGACHKDPKGDGPLTLAGERYKADGYIWSGKDRPSQGLRLLKLLLGFIHVLAGVVWFGSIAYVHLIIKPQSLAGGMPKAEKRLARICIVLVGITGIVLTALKLQSINELWTTTFGIVLTVKMVTYACMIAVAAVATTVIDRRLRMRAQSDGPAKPDGKEGRPAHVTYSGRVYDVSGSKLWKDGTHMARHFAGGDLTEALGSAPHGPEVLERVPDLGPAQDREQDGPDPVVRIFVALAYFVLVCIAIVVLCLAWWRWGPPLVDAFPAWTQAKVNTCVGCHLKTTAPTTYSWMDSAHARNKVSCLHCHGTARSAPDVSTAHFEYGDVPVSAVVSPRDCSLCHLKRVKEFNRSKHAKTIAILKASDPWLAGGLVSPVERVAGCEGCHGTGLGEPVNGLSSANQRGRGIGRVNPDGSVGNCAVCHGRHDFAASVARRAEACGACHVGPDHPQMEIFAESKHGAIYAAERLEWRWEGAGHSWSAGVDYRAPTCTACHISAAGKSPASHDVGRRLSWELKAPLAIRPKGRDWKAARRNMEEVCLQCHAKPWVKGHFRGLDQAVKEYNQQYRRPLAERMDRLYRAGVLDPASVVDEPLEVAFDEMARREGRRAKMGAAMMAPDYSWWHGFYELKKSYLAIERRAALLSARGK